MNTTTMPFGKHKGQPLHDIPSDYLRWALGIANWPLRLAIQRVLTMRAEWQDSPGRIYAIGVRDDGGFCLVRE